MKNPGKHIAIIHVFLGFFISISLHAQNYSLNFGPVYTTSQDTSSFLNTKGIEIINSGTTTISGISYQLLLKDTLNDCKFELCASGNCMGILYNNDILPSLAPGEKGWLQIHFWSGKTYGINKIRYFIQNGSQSDTLTWILKVEQLTGISESEIQQNPIHIFPNPAHSFLEISGVSIDNCEFILLDVFGKTVQKNYLSNDNNRLNIESIPSGMYFYRVKNSSSILRSGKILIAH